MAKDRASIPRSASTGKAGRKPSRSATLASGSAQNGPRLTLKLKFNKEQSVDSESTTQNDQSIEYDNDLPEHVPAPLPDTTRTERRVSRPRHADELQGSDYDRMMELNSDIFDDDETQDHTTISPIPQRPPRPNQQLQPQQSFPSSPLKFPREANKPPTFIPNEDIYAILNALKSTSKIQIDLPSLGSATAADGIQPYTATTLTHLYLTCYQQRLWDLCDLVTDTWIRAFHTRRHVSSSQNKHLTAVWRRNAGLERRKRDALVAQQRGQVVSVEYDSNAPDYNLDVSDPEMELSVTDTDIALLNTLYKYTNPLCGARFMWADALALGGDITEEVMEKAEKQGGGKADRELVFDVMQSALRLVRRKRTLKIEEKAEGAWCGRYHEHGKWGLTCYRERAWREGGGWEGEEGDEMVGVEMSGGRSGGRSVRFGDEDADGEDFEE